MRPCLYALPLMALAGHGAAHVVPLANGTVEALGVCSVSPEAVDCWDMAGRPSPSLRTKMRGQLLSNPSGSFRSGMKNRILVVRRTEPTLQVEYHIESATLSGGSDYGYGRRTDFVPCAVDPQDAAATVTLSAVVPSKGDWKIPLRPGAKVRADGLEVEVGGVSRVPDEERKPTDPATGLPLPGALWSIVLGVDAEDAWAQPMDFAPLDAAGRPIRYVDAEGRPISAVQALTLEPTLPVSDRYGGGPKPPDRPKAARAVFPPNGGGSAFVAFTNIDPKWIASLRLLPKRRVSAVLGSFPMDPR